MYVFGMSWKHLISAPKNSPSLQVDFQCSKPTWASATCSNVDRGSGMRIQCGVATQVSSIQKKWGSPTKMVYHGVSIKI